MGWGIVGALRLIDHFKIDAAFGGGTCVDLEQRLPKRAGAITQTKLLDIAADLRQRGGTDPLAVLREQNRELISESRRNPLARRGKRLLTQELGDTNRGVVALYAEFRLARLAVASKPASSSPAFCPL